MFIVTITYLAPPETIDAHRPAHRAFLDVFYERGIFLASGPMSAGGGGIIVAGNVAHDALEALLRDDPYAVHGVARHEIVAFEAVKFAPAVAEFVGG